MKLSIIVPCYNASKTIEKCVDSLINNTYTDKEIILVNDGSTDNTKNIIDKYAEKYANVFSYSKDNEGLGITRNYGIKKSTGDYITFVDSDDYIDKDCYQTMINLLEKENSDVVYCGFKYIYGKEVMQDNFNCKTYYDNNIEFIEYIFSLKKKYCGVSACTGIYKKSILNKIRNPFFSEKEYISEDKLFNYRYLQKVQKISVINKAFYNYVQQTGGRITTSFKKYKFFAAYNMASYMLNEERNEYLKQLIYIDYLVNLSGCFQMLFIDKNIDFFTRKRIVNEVLSNKDYNYMIKKINSEKLTAKFKIFRILLLYKLTLLIFIMFYLNSKKK